MDFKHQIGSSLQLATLRADALLLVVTPDLLESAGSRQVQLALDPVLKRLIADAVKAGDFALKSGRTLYLHHPEGVVAARVVVTVAANQSAKAYKAALAHGLTLLKSGGASQLLIGGTVSLLQEHAFAAVVAAGDAHYVYRHSKPSAPTSPKWSTRRCCTTFKITDERQRFAPCWQRHGLAGVCRSSSWVSCRAV